MKNLVIYALLATAAIGAAPAQAKEPKLNERALRAAMADMLKDSDSAEFSNITYIPFKKTGPTAYQMCGKVNAKNSYGAYAGAEWFYAIADVEKGKVNYIVFSIGEDAINSCAKAVGLE